MDNSESTTPEPLDAEALPAGCAAVERLTPAMAGRWLVLTRRSAHIWDLDALTYTRMPGEGSQRFAYDGQPHPITRVGAYPAVGGQSIVWYDDPENAALEQWRVSSTVQEIVRLPADAPQP